MKKNWKLIVMLSIFVASLMLSAFPLAQVAQAKGTATRISLTASARYPSAKATAKYSVSSEREFQVEIENVKVLAGKTLSVYANGVKVGNFVVNSLGAGRLYRSTARGQFVPFIRVGSPVVIRFGLITVASGRF